MRVPQREVRRSGAPGPGRRRAAPAVGGGQGDGGRVLPVRLGRAVPEFLSPHRKCLALQEWREKLRSPSASWQELGTTGREVSLLWGLEVLKKDREGGQAWRSAARPPSQQKGLSEQNNLVQFSVAIRIKLLHLGSVPNGDCFLLVFFFFNTSRLFRFDFSSPGLEQLQVKSQPPLTAHLPSP